MSRALRWMTHQESFSGRRANVEYDKQPPPGTDALADYNAERSEGLVHNPEYAARMAEIQAEFNEWSRTVTMTVKPRAATRLFLYLKGRLER